MAEYVGSAAVLQWIWSGGTVSLTPDFRNIQWAPSLDYIDATAGQDTTRQRLPSFKDATLSATMVGQSGTASDYAAALDAGVSGTVIYGPSGTVAANRKITMPAYAGGLQFTSPYDDVTETSIEFTANGAYTLGTY